MELELETGMETKLVEEVGRQELGEGVGVEVRLGVEVGDGIGVEVADELKTELESKLETGWIRS